MKQIIATDTDKCQGCSNCVGVCPVEQANIISVVDKKLRILVDSQKCIACGACLRACPYNARYYNDDTGRFFADLKEGKPIALIVAPSFITNFSNWKAILAWLKTQGASVIVDVSLGIEICSWAHMRYIERYNKTALIIQPCPPIASYVEKNRPELLKKLSPVFSPIVCTAVYIKKVLKLPGKIATLTPCPAKADEFEKATTVGYNVTFKKLVSCLAAHDITIPQADFNFDNINAIPGRGYIIPSNPIKNIKRPLGCLSFNDSQMKVDVIENCGNVYRYLDDISECEGNCPVLFDALNCIGGCRNGAGSSIEANHGYDQGQLDNACGQTGHYSVFDDMLELADYIKTDG